MIRCDVFINLFFSNFGDGQICALFQLSLSLSLLSSSRNRHLLLLEEEKTSLFNSSSLTPPPPALSSSSFIFYVNSDGTSYAQAMCAPKLNPLIASGTEFSLPLLVVVF